MDPLHPILPVGPDIAPLTPPRPLRPPAREERREPKRRPGRSQPRPDGTDAAAATPRRPEGDDTSVDVSA